MIRAGMIFCLGGAAAVLTAQTLVDLRAQTKNVDFSTAQSTKPVKVGTALPANCAVGELFFNSGVAAGGNLYGCVAANTWSQISSSASQSSTSGASATATLTPGFGLYSDGSTLTADLSVMPGLASGNAYQNLNDFSGGQIRIQTADGAPTADQCAAAANVGKLYARSDITATPLYLCAQTAAGVYGWVTGFGTGGSSSAAAGGVQVLPVANFMPGQGGFPSAYVFDTTVAGWGGAANGNPYAVFPATGTAYIVVGTYLPGTWTGTLKVGLRHTTMNGGTGAGQYLLSAACVADTAVSTSLTFGNVTTVALSVVNGQWKMNAAALDLTGSACSPGAYLYVKVQRDNTVASNYGDSVRMGEIVVLY